MPNPPSGHRRTRLPSERVRDDARSAGGSSRAPRTTWAKRWNRPRPRASCAAPSCAASARSSSRAAAPRRAQLVVAHAVDPCVDLRPVDLEMELRGPGAIAQPERLVGDAVAGREQRRALGQLEGVHVPLERRIAVDQQRPAADRRRDASVRRIGTKPISRTGALCTDSRAPTRAPARRSRSRGRARRAPTCRARQVAHRVQERLLVGVLDVERAAEQDDRARRRRRSGAGSPPIASQTACGRADLGERPQARPRRSRHGRRARTGSDPSSADSRRLRRRARPGSPRPAASRRRRRASRSPSALAASSSITKQ